ncbi:Ubiquitin-like-conjugating enzyme ATG10 [Blattella germanica]|nr:Ubiquitin-like-conjugating enzyme ATG10 [Blattella germanica]
MAVTVTWEEFQRCMSNFLKISNSLSDGWVFQGNEDIPGGAYLLKKLVVEDKIEKQLDSSYSLEEPLEELLEDSSTLCKINVDTITWEYHIIYSQSYAVPTLYFNAWRNDGSLLNLEEIWTKMHKVYQDSLEDRWSVLTQQEHPLLRRPFYMLHPCRTSEFLDCLKNRTSNIIITWLSTFGPTVGLTLNPEYGQSVVLTVEEKPPS